MQVLRSDIETPAQSHHLTDLRFADLPLSAGLQKGIAEAGFVHCTPIQSKTLPLALDGQDVAGQAQTGTGKTAAFLLALFHRLEHNPPLSTEPGPPAPRALIMAPTRELAVQVHTDATALGKHLPFKLGLAFGGTDYDKQRDVLAAGVDVLIGTPGRLIDFYKQRVFGLRGVQVLVLDEADRMFDLGFIKDIRYVLRRLPEHHRRLNMLFSATLSHRVLELAYEHMNDPELVRIEPDKMTVDRVTQSIYFPAMEEKLPLLLTLLRDRDPHRTMIFVNTRREADRLRDALVHNGIKAEALSGDVPQRKRLRMLKDFQAGELAVLDRHGRRVARPARARREPRVQLRSAAGPRGLRASHRPHGARRRHRRRDQLRLRDVRDLAARDRERSSAARFRSRRSTTARSSARSPTRRARIGRTTARPRRRRATPRPARGAGDRGTRSVADAALDELEDAVDARETRRSRAAAAASPVGESRSCAAGRTRAPPRAR